VTSSLASTSTWHHPCNLDDWIQTKAAIDMLRHSRVEENMKIVVIATTVSLLTAAPFLAQGKGTSLSDAGGYVTGLAGTANSTDNQADAGYRYSRIAADDTLSASPLSVNGMAFGFGFRF
jgi:hypothetical protein